MNILVTGGSGFIGSNFIRFLLENHGGNIQVYNLDKITYAGSGRNLEHMGITKDSRYRFARGDVADVGFVQEVFEGFKPNLVFHFAAESHVDTSIKNSAQFVSSNVAGTVNLLNAALKGLEKFVQISTDEVYGSIRQGSFSEDSRLYPSNPYSASKASAEAFALAYHKTHDVPVVITRSSNNFGPFQFPEKLIPLFVTNLIDGKKVPLMWSDSNPGLNVRDWVYVEDNCRGIWHAAMYGKAGEVYNVPGNNEATNMQITERLLSHFGFGKDMIEQTQHRKGHDFRYSISGEKLGNIGFDYSHVPFNQRLDETCEWYKKNEKWWRPLKQK